MCYALRLFLDAFKNDHVTWLTDEKAFPLLEGNKYIHRILAYNLSSVLQLKSERFDTILNFEKIPGVCALSDSINAWRRFGFRFDEITGEAQSYDGAERVLALSFDLAEKRKNEQYWQQALMHMLGKEWNGEKYKLGYKPHSKVKFDIGFNWAVGPKWPNKSWPKQYWQQLEYIMKKDFSISWQQGLKDIREYIEWINSCRLIVTNDSLGLHIAIALGKKIIALFGPTSHKEIYLYGLGVKLLPKVNYSCMPCLNVVCRSRKNCMYFIDPKKVGHEIRALLD